ncbi:hypothetical protein HUJ04_004913 [Dendroctonus ponderosae]|nr:hypothetical protein HUJ04_004913 [Dendroctonus ponderosae]
MTITYFNDISVYFHMRNHYKMLKNVKSTVDTSIPQSLLKSPMAMHGLDKQSKGATNEHLRKIYNTSAHQSQPPKRRGLVKKHNCLNSEAKSEACLLGASSSRPGTRRNDNATPKEPLPYRSFSTAPFYNAEPMFKLKQKKRHSVLTTRSVNNPSTESQSTRLHLELPQDNSQTSEHVSAPTSQRTSISKEEDHSRGEDSNTSPTGSAEDHEYLLFLLRITEDIISNDFYSNSDIKMLFKSHVDLNKDRLNMVRNLFNISLRNLFSVTFLQRKMHLHIVNLCKELNIDCKEYQTLEDVNQPDSLNKFQNSPNGHSYVLSSEAFQGCRDCSVIRTSSLYKMQSIAESHNLSGDHNTMGNVSPVTPSLLKLLQKLSLGRVTERTEPAASTSTINSSNLHIPNTIENDEENDDFDGEKGPTDFDTFVKELNSKETNLEALNQKGNDVATFNDPSEEPVADLFSEKNQHEALTDSNSIDSVNVTQTPIGGSKTDIESSEKLATNSYSTSDFEKCSLTNSATTARKAERETEEVTKDVEEERMESAIPELNSEKLRENDDLESVASRKIQILTKERGNMLPKNKTNATYSKSLTALTESPQNTTSNKLHSVPTSARSNLIPDEDSILPLSDKKADDTEFLNLKQFEPLEILKQPEHCREITNSKDANPHLENEEKPCKTSDLKVILQGSIKDEDYVMIKGPVYVYKALLDSQPKLIVLAENSEQTRRDSMDSHKTFTVENRDVPEKTNLDQGVQYDVSLHSLEADTSMENILELTRTAYSQFMDMKLLDSDYDLTPEKDRSDNKYHHLLLDATTSVSGVNIPESLLLSDEYLVQNNRFTSTSDKKIGESRAEVGIENIIDDLGYRRFEPKLCEKSYVLHSKLTSSVSMPKLKLTGDASIRVQNKSIAKQRSSDLIHFQLSSQDSSLRSEGEAVNNIDFN